MTRPRTDQQREQQQYVYRVLALMLENELTQPVLHAQWLFGGVDNAEERMQLRREAKRILLRLKRTGNMRW